MVIWTTHLVDGTPVYLTGPGLVFAADTAWWPWAVTGTGTLLVLLHRGGAHPRVTAACTVALLGAFVALVGVDGELADVEHLLAFVLGLATAAVRSPSEKLATVAA